MHKIFNKTTGQMVESCQDFLQADIVVHISLM